MNAAALVSGLTHTIIDFHLGLFGATSTSLSMLQAANVVLTCLVVAWWVICLGATPGTARPGLSGAVTLALVWVFLGNGMAILLAPPPADAFPFQDLAHVFSLVFGALAAYTTWRELRHSRTPWSWEWASITILLTIGLFVVQTVVSAPNL